jgi:hypothetical protein
LSSIALPCVRSPDIVPAQTGITPSLPSKTHEPSA